MEKRTSDRHQQQAFIICSYFNSAQYFPAKLLNYSEGGLSFESVTAFQPGIDLYVRLECLLPASASACLHSGFRSVTLGEVKWCRDLSSADTHKYDIGIKYHQPDY